MEKDELTQFLNGAIAAATAAGPLIREGQADARAKSEKKADGSVVTAFDKAAEQVIRGHLTALDRREITGIIGEEFAALRPDRRYQWHIDPIDGTSLFVKGLPTFATLLALEDAQTGEAIIGVVHAPVLGQTWWAGKGLGAFCDGKPIKASTRDNLARSHVALPPRAQFEQIGMGGFYADIAGAAPYAGEVLGSWCHGYIAQGLIDVAIWPFASSWDIRASQCLVTEAGGKFLKCPTPGMPDKETFIFGASALADQVAQMGRARGLGF